MDPAALSLLVGAGLAAVPVGILGVALKAHKRTVAEQRHIIRRLDDCLTVATDWVWETDSNGVFTYLSHQLEDIIGIPIESLIGKTRKDLAGTPSAQLALKKIDEAMARQEPFSDITYGLLLPDGSLKHMRVSGKPVTDMKGQPCGYRGIGTDVTQQVVAREAALSAETRLRIAIEGIPEGFALCSIAGVITMRNRRLGRMVDRAGGRMEADPTLRSILTSCAEDQRAINDYLDAWYTRVAKPMEFRCHSGLIYVARLQISPDNSILLTLSDVSEQRRAEKAEQRLEDERRQAQKLEAIGTLAGGIAHEINTPIQYIGDNVRFVASLLPDLIAVAEELRTENDTRSLEQAWRAARTIVERIDLDFVREEAPLALEQTLEGITSVSRIVLAMKEFSHPSHKDPVPFDLNRNIENTVTISRNEWKIVATVDLDLATDLPPVIGLPGDLNQVFLNLMVNAAHAIEDARRPDIGTITIRTRRLPKAETGAEAGAEAGAATGDDSGDNTGDWVEISFRDTGCGIPDTIRDKIFEPFFTTKDVGRGSGQGLAIAHDIITRKHGGRIAVDSTPGAGTTFTLTIPLDCSTLPHYQHPDHARTPGPSSETKPGTTPGAAPRLGEVQS